MFAQIDDRGDRHLIDRKWVDERPVCIGGESRELRQERISLPTKLLAKIGLCNQKAVGQIAMAERLSVLPLLTDGRHLPVDPIHDKSCDFCDPSDGDADILQQPCAIFAVTVAAEIQELVEVKAVGPVIDALTSHEPERFSALY